MSLLKNKGIHQKDFYISLKSVLSICTILLHREVDFVQTTTDDTESTNRHGLRVWCNVENTIGKTIGKNPCHFRITAAYWP